MEKRNWTENQIRAIRARNGALLVSAAAGSGKTAVLVERVIERITDPANPTDADKLLVVTFTRAAAAEMKERITLKLEELLHLDPHNINLRRQQLLLAKANISTIHSFCSELVRENFYKLGISPDYRLAEENELLLLQYEAVNNVIETLYEQNTAQEFYHFANVFSTAKSDFLLQQVLLRLYDFLRAHPFPDRWLADKEKMYDPEIPVEKTQWGQVITEYVQAAAAFCKELAEESLRLWEQLPDLGEALYELLKKDADSIEKILTAVGHASWDVCRACLQAFDSRTRFVSAKGYKDDPIKCKIQANRDLLKKTLKTLLGFYQQEQQECRQDICALLPVVHQLFGAVRLFAEEYSRLKSEKNLADYNDLEHWTLHLLLEETEDGFAFTQAAQDIASRFAEVMVDEYQDANEIQDLIFRAVSRNGENLFVVGDVKQSIYGFRQAMPAIFLRRKNNYPLYDPQKDAYPAKVILDQNFRSRSGVTAAVNFVFGHLMSQQVGDMDYTQEEALLPGAQYPIDHNPDMAFHLLHTGMQQQEEADILEARHIASIIHRYMDTYQITEKNGTRAAKYSDFCILLRGVSNHAEFYVKELINCGIPAAAQSGGGFLSLQEVSVMLAYLRILDNPLQDIPLLTVLLSPMGGFTADDLAKIRAEKPKGRLFFALKAYAQAGNRRAQDFLAETGALRRKAATTPTDLLIQSIYTKTGYTAVVQAAEGGSAALSHLRLLQEHAKSFERSGYKGLGSFIRFIDKLQEKNGDLPSGNSFEGDDCVKVMSIHHSKGLEFPICFIAAAARSFKSDKADEVLLHGELGIGIRKKDPVNQCRYTTMPRQAVALAIDRESKSEELRILYVAMTRAREKLYIIGSQKDPQRYLKGVAAKLGQGGKLSPYIVRSANSILTWITQCALLHPSGRQLRKLAGMPQTVMQQDCSQWDIRLVESIESPREQTETTSISEKQAPPCNLDAAISRITAPYPHHLLTKIPAKVAASDLAHQQVSARYAFTARPAFLHKGAMTGAEKGTALHSFMQFADFQAFLESPHQEIHRLSTNGFITPRQAQALDLEQLTKCLTSSVLQRYCKAEKTYREFRFTVKIKAGLADQTLSPPYSDAQMILQGAVDCAFEENGAIVIVDYKSDHVKDMGELCEKYKTQLFLYKNAMEQCTGLPVAECILYSFYLNEFCTVTL